MRLTPHFAAIHVKCNPLGTLRGETQGAGAPEPSRTTLDKYGAIF